MPEEPDERLARLAGELEHVRRAGELEIASDASAQGMAEALTRSVSELAHVSSALAHWFDADGEDLYLGRRGGEHEGAPVAAAVALELAGVAAELHALAARLRAVCTDATDLQQRARDRIAQAELADWLAAGEPAWVVVHEDPSLADSRRRSTWSEQGSARYAAAVEARVAQPGTSVAVYALPDDDDVLAEPLLRLPGLGEDPSGLMYYPADDE